MMLNSQSLEKDFPRGGVKPPSRKRRLEDRTDQELFMTGSPQHRRTGKSLEGESQHKKKWQKDTATQDVGRGPRLKLNKKPKVKMHRTLPSADDSGKIMSLKFSHIEVGMQILGCVSMVGRYRLTLSLPGGLFGEVSIGSVSDAYTEVLKTLGTEDEDQNQKILSLSEMFKVGMLLPCKVLAIKIGSGAKRKIHLSINPSIVNGELSAQDLTQGLILSGCVKTGESHGYEIDLGVHNVRAFLSSKQAARFLEDLNIGVLQVGQVLRCCVLSVSSSHVKLSANPQVLRKAQMPVIDGKSAIVAGAKYLCSVNKIQKTGLVVSFCGKTGYIHCTHTREYHHARHFSVGDKVVGTVLYTLSGAGKVYLSLLPHLAKCTSQNVYRKFLKLRDQLHDVTLLQALKKAAYFTLPNGTQAVATLSSMKQVTGSRSPTACLNKRLKYRCSISAFNLIDRTVHIRLLSVCDREPDAAKRKETDAKSSASRMKQEGPENKIRKVQNKDDICDDFTPPSISPKHKTELTSPGTETLETDLKKSKEEKEKKKIKVETKSDKKPIDTNSIFDTEDDLDLLQVSQTSSQRNRLAVPAEFSWSDDLCITPPLKERDATADTVSEDEDMPITGTKSPSWRKSEEKSIYSLEQQMVTGDALPMTSDDFDRLVLQSPDSSIVWTRYMAFHLETMEIEKARTVAERALKTITFREEQEKFNIWMAYANLENLYGAESQLEDVVRRAVEENEPLKVYKQLAQIFISSGKLEQAEKVYMDLSRKYSKDTSVWTLMSVFYFKNNNLEAARNLLQRSLKALQQKDHVDVICKFAQLEYKYGDAQRGCSMFENILSSYPKRTDIWSIFLDMVVKTGSPEDVRLLFERIIHMKMSSKKKQFFFKKYLNYEMKYGDSKSVEKVKQKAVAYVESFSQGNVS